jgi:hypothetical protein
VVSKPLPPVEKSTVRVAGAVHLNQTDAPPMSKAW